MKVYVLMMGWPYEGERLHSVHATKEAAVALKAKLSEGDTYTDYRVLEEEVRGCADKEKAPESSDPEAVCYLCKRDYLKCRCIPL